MMRCPYCHREPPKDAVEILGSVQISCELGGNVEVAIDRQPMPSGKTLVFEAMPDREQALVPFLVPAPEKQRCAVS